MHEYYFIADPDPLPPSVSAYVGRSNLAALALSRAITSPLVAPLVAYTPLSDDEAIYQIPPHLCPYTGPASIEDRGLLLDTAAQLERANVVYGDGAILWDALRRIPVFADWQHATVFAPDAVLHMGPFSVDFALVPPQGTALSTTNVRDICASFDEPWEPYRAVVGMPRNAAVAWLSARPGLDRRRLGRYLSALKDRTQSCSTDADPMTHLTG